MPRSAFRPVRSRSTRSALLLTGALLTLTGCDGTPSAAVAGPAAQFARAATPTASPAAVQASALANFEAAHRALSGRGIIRDDGSPLWTLLGQSPINIPGNRTVKLLSLDPVIGWTPFVPEVEDNPHEVKVSTDDLGGTLTIRGKVYAFKQFHFHRSSEHTIDGKRSAMEVHFVHIAQDGAIAVVGVLMDLGPANAALEPIWPNAVPMATSAPTFDASKLLPALNAPYYTYSGSLTTGLYNEGLTWIVYKQPIRLSAAQLKRYAEAFEEENAREVQPLAGRTVFERVGGGR
jgi:carbonic anhydrase